MSDFRHRFGLQLATAAAGLAVADESDFRARFGLQLTRAAGELAAARSPLTTPAARARSEGAPRIARPRLPRWKRPSLGLAGPAMDFRARFGLQLTRAAHELAAPARRERAVRLPRLSLPRLGRPVAVGLSLTAFAGTAVAATVVLWAPQLGSSNYAGPRPTASAGAPPQAQLSALGVFRRAADPATDRGGLTQTALSFVNSYTSSVETNYVRLLASDGHGGGFVLVPAQRLAAGVGGVPARAAAAATTTTLNNSLCVYADRSGFVAVNCYTFEQVLAGDARTLFGDQVFGLAPDSASSVTITFANGVSTTAPVKSNFFDATPPSGAAGAPTVTFSSTTATS